MHSFQIRAAAAAARGGGGYVQIFLHVHTKKGLDKQEK